MTQVLPFKPPQITGFPSETIYNEVYNAWLRYTLPLFGSSVTGYYYVKM